MNLIKKYFSNKKVITAIVLVFIIALAFAVRFYKFDEWLYFKMDQSRDAFMTSGAVINGAGNLPLLGPRAGATTLRHGFLRLGPAFYYFQYIAGKTFNSTEPYVFAYPELFFSILTIPLLYFFVRLYFSRRNSLFIVAMYSFSFIIIQYSRFSWNPNSLQFFVILSFFGLIKSLNGKRENHRRWWLVLGALGLAIGSQLHFFGLFSLGIITVLFLATHFELWRKEKILILFKREIAKKIVIYISIIAAVFSIVYSPVIISDIMKSGQNAKNFFEAVGSKPEAKPLMEKISKDITENLKYYCLLTTANCYEGKVREKNNILSVLLTGLILLAGIYLTINKLRKTKNPVRRDFLILLLIWVGVFSILTIPVSFQLRPRFFIIVFAIPFIFLGLLFEFLEEKYGKKAIFATSLITIAILGMNIGGTKAWFLEQKKSQIGSPTIKRTLILKNQDGVTLGQLQGAVDYIYNKRKENGNIYFYVKPEHIRPVDYLLYNKKDENLKYFSFKLNGDPAAQYFVITPTKNGIEPFRKKYGDDFIILSSQEFGQITVYEADFPNRVVNPSEKEKKDSASEDRLFWKDILK